MYRVSGWAGGRDAVVDAGVAPVAGQDPTAAAKTWMPPRAPWSKPDLLGKMVERHHVPFEQSDLAGKQSLDEDETAALEARFTCVDADTRLYEFTVDDPTTLTRILDSSDSDEEDSGSDI